MRQILFCGKRIDNNEWAYGYYALEPNGKHYILTNEGDSWDGIELLTEIEIDPSSISQFTGLTDKNYNKIFENAKVKLPNGQIGIVCMENGSFGICVDECINYDNIQEIMDSNDFYCGNEYTGCFNDNFISLWELYWNFNCDENCIDVIEIMEE